MAAQLYRTLTGQSQKSQDGQEPTTSAPKLVRTTTTDPLTGSLNHLTPDQTTKLEQFKEVLEKDGWWTPNGVNGKPSHDTGTLLRYLRARKFDIDGAVGQFTDTEKWMKEERVEELYEHFDVEFYERARTLYPQWTGRRDKRGIPIYVYEIKGLDSKSVTKYQKESQKYKDNLPQYKDSTTAAKMMPLFALYHNLLNFILPLCSTLERPNPEIPVTNSTNIVDIAGVGLTQFWNLKQHMQDASVLATAHYPETLDRIFIIGAPAFFPTVWGWIKRWFDPVTVSKIFILNKTEVKSTLETFMDPENIPKKYGGMLDWGWGDLPDIGAAEKEALETDGVKGWIRGPCLYLEHQRIAVGSEDGKLRRSDKEVAEKKPVLYAADYTEEPVHPERRASSVSSSTKASDKKMNGTASVPPGTNTPPTVAVIPEKVENEVQTPTPQTKETRNLNVHNSPSGDSQVHLPDTQAAPPSVTAEYISPAIKPKPDEYIYREPEAPTTTARTSAPKVDQALHGNPVNTVPPPKVEQPSHRHTIAGVPPPGQIQPGPLPKHAIEMNRKIARQLEGESVSVIPAEGNGTLAHPDIIVASDRSKGLAIEADKLALNGSAEKHGEHDRPPMERFVTAAQF